MSNPLFSILIANYNNGKYLMEAIDSVRWQTYTHWEIILVDDASTDNSKELYKELEKDNRIHIYYNEENRGCGYTKRRCADLATGELCGFLDPDDALTPDALQIMVEQHTAHPEASTIGSCYWCCDEHMNKLWHADQWVYSEGKCYLTDFQHLRPIAFASYKRESYLQTEGINPNLKRAVDVDLYAKLEEKGSIVMIGNVMYYYRLHNCNISIGNRKAIYWHILVLQDAAKRRNIDIEQLADQLLSIEPNKFKKEIETIKESIYYKLGYIVISPFNKIHKRIKRFLCR